MIEFSAVVEPMLMSESKAVVKEVKKISYPFGFWLTNLQSLLVMHDPGYVSERWHGTMLTFAVSAISIFVNVVFARDLPLIEGLVVIIHVFSWIGIVVTLWVVSPMGDARTVFTTFSDNGGWGNIGGSTLIGITTSILPFMGADAAVHMSEEVKDASRSIPLSMIW